MTQPRMGIRAIRLILLGMIVGFAAYWAGARWGARQATKVEALPIAAKGEGNASLTDALETKGVSDGQNVLADLQRRRIAERQRRELAPLGINLDQRNDVALIKIDPKGRKLTALPLGDSSALQVGQHVLAIGNPFGFQSTLTTGVVSALGRTVQTSQTTFIDEAIQTDAAINRGNSGGPLINSRGEVIGINSAIYTPSGTTAGIGFAIPINTAKMIAHDLRTDGRVHQAVLGVETLPLAPGLAEALDLPVQEGLLIQRTARGGPADKAGLRGGDHAALLGMRRIFIGGDVIVAVDGQKTASQLDLSLVLNHKRPGNTVAVTFYRGGRKMDAQVTLGERSE